uniref:E3 ubiquitin-protein ligase CHFR n=2 Tax=Cuerna arida TaxID=1464854 RepID=A0A1B6EI08_9HEMI
MSDNSSVGSVLAALIQGNERHFMFQDVNVIGRSPDAFISIEDKLISRRHCVIEKSSGNSFTICDMSSKGTYLNGKKMLKNQVYELHHRDKISLANLEKYTYSFVLNRKFTATNESHAELTSRLKEKILIFDNTYTDNMKKLNSKLTQIETEKSDLKKEMNNKLEEQESTFKRERLSLSTILNSTNEQKEEAERKLIEMEVNCELEKKMLMAEVESKIADISKKEAELQQIKNEMELRYQRERVELEERCKAEVEELKEKLADFQVEQERLQSETREAEQKLKETKKILLECELEQFRLCEEKVEVELKLESKIIDLTKESTSKDEVVKDLERRIQEKDKAAEKLKKDIEVLEEELQCSICAELFIEPTVLNCGHMFCKTCIDEWKTKKKICPMCRAKIVTSVRIFTVDTIIEKNVALLSAEARSRRESLILQRQKGNQTSVRAKKRKQLSHRAETPPVHPRRSRTVVEPMHVPPLMVQLMPQGMERVENMDVYMMRNHDQDDPFLWAAAGRMQMRTRTATQLERRPEPWVEPAGPTVTVAAIDLTNIPPAPNLTTREPIDLTSLPQELNIPSTSTAHLNSTIDLTSP